MCFPQPPKRTNLCVKWECDDQLTPPKELNLISNVRTHSQEILKRGTREVEDQTFDSYFLSGHLQCSSHDFKKTVLLNRFNFFYFATNFFNMTRADIEQTARDLLGHFEVSNIYDSKPGEKIPKGKKPARKFTKKHVSTKSKKPNTSTTVPLISITTPFTTTSRTPKTTTTLITTTSYTIKHTTTTSTIITTLTTTTSVSTTSSYTVQTTATVSTTPLTSPSTRKVTNATKMTNYASKWTNASSLTSKATSFQTKSITPKPSPKPIKSTVKAITEPVMPFFINCLY